MNIFCVGKHRDGQVTRKGIEAPHPTPPPLFYASLLFGCSWVISLPFCGKPVTCSNCGLVNMYNKVSCPQETSPKQTKAMMNLVISVTSQSSIPLQKPGQFLQKRWKKQSDWVTTLPVQYFQTSQSFKGIFFIPWIFLLEVDILPWGIKRLEVQVVPLSRFLERLFEIQLSHKRSLFWYIFTETFLSVR